MEFFAVLLFAAGLILLVALHELGHIVAGKLVGFRFHSIQVGPFRLSKTTTGFHFGLTSTLWAGGLASMLPQNPQDLVKRYRWFAAGGPIASFLPVIPCVIGTIYENKLAALLLLPSIMGLMGSATPRGMGEDDDLKSDGEIIAESFREPEQLRRKLLLWSVFAAWESGERPRDWPIHMLDNLNASELEGEQLLAVYLLRYYHQIDADRLREALAEIAAAFAVNLDEPNNSFAMMALLEAAYAHARSGDAVLARARLQQAETPEHLERIRLRAEAAVLFAEGKGDASKEVAERARAQIKAHPPLESFDEAELEMIEAIFGTP
ncbi:MAG: site-2 protease family protein [Fimbriimonadaceae bacterium]